MTSKGCPRARARSIAVPRRAGHEEVSRLSALLRGLSSVGVTSSLRGWGRPLPGRAPSALIAKPHGTDSCAERLLCLVGVRHRQDHELTSAVPGDIGALDIDPCLSQLLG